jgi:hypothetical protein
MSLAFALVISSSSASENESLAQLFDRTRMLAAAVDENARFASSRTRSR